MSLLPNRFQIVNDMPSLGALVKEAIQPKPCQIAAFNKHDHGWKSLLVHISEEDCRQIKGAAQSGSGRDALKQSASVAAPPSPAVVAGKFKPGDKVRYRSEIAHMRGSERVVAAVRENFEYFGKTVTRVEFTCGTSAWDEADALELIPPAVTPDDGWIEWKKPEMPPIPGSSMLQVKTKLGNKTQSHLGHRADAFPWAGKYIVAYRVVK